ncbi:ethanolamine ammonia-lyase subunit EutC [Humitalea sp. 24SJ18S-53]|uniref:ethanolamine ammonia-lyase subunit EutC n=1 Tax=Humitalea sp. 24SJ18S-53 TaxID=3422307 RepID=UPI003D66BD0A
MTTARVALGRAGNAVPTASHLAFQADHAAARDAVWSALDAAALVAEAASLDLPILRVASQAVDRRSYLLRPDQGRRLRPADLGVLEASAHPGAVVFVAADGLCALGVQAQAVAVVSALLDPLRRLGFVPGPFVVAEQARVALGDEIGGALGALAVVMLIGERPGLSSTDSLGAYLTWGPRVGRTDAERNCISNIRPGGLSPPAAAAKIAWLLAGARAQSGTGVALKDEQPEAPLALG